MIGRYRHVAGSPTFRLVGGRIQDLNPKGSSKHDTLIQCQVKASLRRWPSINLALSQLILLLG